jgi:archaellum component FlaG (FlaF/FlaG flagellin family)
LIRDSLILSNLDSSVVIPISGKVTKKKVKLNYKKVVTIKGKRKHSWYTDIAILSVSYEDMKSSDFINLETLFKNEGTVIVFYQNERFYCIIDGESIEYDSEYSEVIEDDLYKGSITFEETTSEYTITNGYSFPDGELFDYSTVDGGTY